MLYLIGGSARCGKSTLARTLRKHTRAQSVSGDALRVMLKKTQPNSEIGRIHTNDLGYDTKTEQGYIKYYGQHTDHAVEKMLLQAEIMSNPLHHYSHAVQLESPDDLIIESVDIHPSTIQRISDNCKAVFLIDTSDDQHQRIKDFPDQYSWMNNRLNDAQIKAWAVYNKARSIHIKELCKQQKIQCFDLKESGYHTVQQLALQYLLDD